MRSPELQSINCTSCGAGLDILGGGRVTTHICPYCGSELDALDGYKLLKKNSDLTRPDTPFAIGQKGTIKGVSWTIIGTLGLHETHNGKTWDWVEHQLYAPTHGYAWLVVENGHTSFARRQRRMPHPAWMGVSWVETAENKPSVTLKGERFTYYQTSTAQLTFAEGEFTWSPQIGDTTVTVSAMSEAHMLDFAETGAEREAYRSEYLDPRETLAAFGLPKDALKQRGSNPLAPFRTTPTLRFVKLAATVCMALCLLIGLILSFLPGRETLPAQVLDLNALPQTVSFEITDPTRLATLYLRSNNENAWTYVDIEVEDPEDLPLFETGRSMEFYRGRDADGTWSEGNNRARLSFHPTIAGTYSVTFSGAERGTWDSPGFGATTASRLEISVSESQSSGTPLYSLLFGFLLVAGALWLRQMWHHQRRWAGSDWTEEDE